MVNVEQLTQAATELLLSYGPKLLLALLTLIVGFWIIKRVVAMGEAMMERSQVDITLRKFLVNLGSLISLIEGSGHYQRGVHGGGGNHLVYCNAWSCGVGDRFGAPGQFGQFCRWRSHFVF